jgi:hypothetical protein
MIVAEPPALVVTCQAADGAGASGWVLEAPGDGVGARLTFGRLDAEPSQAAVPEAPRPEAARGDEWQIGTGYAWSTDLLQSHGGRRYVPVSVSWARNLTSEGGPGFLRGRLSWGVEVMAPYLQTAPTSTIGVGVSPLVWRWSFVPRRRWAPFAELAFGGLFATDPVPEGTEAANFIAHGAFGLRWRPSHRVGIVTAYRFQHISNGNQLSTNPGVNANVAWVGVSLIR